MRGIAPLLFLFAAGCVHGTHVEFPVQRLELAEADSLLMPGDFLFRWVDAHDPLVSQVSGAIISGGEVTVQASSEAIHATEDVVRDLMQEDRDRFAHALDEGDPNAVHVAIYLGGGESAEAFGTSLDDPRVRVWPLFADYRRPAAWRVLRHRDPAVRAAIADVARRWASGRMGYAVPFDVFAQDASWGEHARQSAWAFARAYDVEGGPPEVSQMFCSQFAVAVLQSAMTHVRFPHAAAAADLDALPVEARLDAIASPLRVFGEWAQSGEFEPIAHVMIE
ncbi:MAG: hypothetical protein U0234_24110 [Sandaracinus sp.]